MNFKRIQTKIKGICLLILIIFSSSISILNANMISIKKSLIIGGEMLN